jgi:LysM repeat protein
MSAVEGLPVPPTPADPHVEVDTTSIPALCPYLATPDGGWRRATAVRDHRCMAVAPPVPLALEKQRRLCLVAAHTGCSTFGAAQASRATATRPLPPMRPVARMTPVILDHGRFDLRLPALRAYRGSGQAALVAVLGIALVALLVARPSGDGGAVGALGSASPAASRPAPTEAAAASPTTPSAEPSSAPPSDAPSSPPEASAEPPDATPSVASSAAPSTSGETYKVKSGDTLSAIAGRFNTTVRILVELNAITDPSRLRVGQVIKLP